MSMDTLASPRRFDNGDFPFEGPTPARVWGDQWLRVSEKVLKGLNHKLTNRVAALEAVVAIAEPNGAPDPELIAALAKETAELHQLLRLFRLMPAEPFAEPEPSRLQDIVPSVLALHRHHADLKEIPFELHADEYAHPILVRQSALLRCLLVLLEAAAGRAALGDDSCPRGHEQVQNDVVITIEGPAPPAQLIFSGEGSLLHAVRSALAHAHGAVDAIATPSTASTGCGTRSTSPRSPPLVSSNATGALTRR
ncbi:MAG: hypothetical protein U0163_09815 [Gemmatimonadaceae bacterium]